METAKKEFQDFMKDIYSLFNNKEIKILRIGCTQKYLDEFNSKVRNTLKNFEDLDKIINLPIDSKFNKYRLIDGQVLILEVIEDTNYSIKFSDGVDKRINT